MDDNEIKYFIEAAMLAAGRPLTVDQLQDLFDGRSAPDKPKIRAAIAALNEDYEPRGITVAEVASGFRIQVKSGMSSRLQKLWEERAPRYSRALFETLALVAYRQPITRGEIEEVRGVAVSSNIVRTLLEREWIRVVGHRDVPGRPAMFGTTRLFLDYFGLKKLDDLPPLADLTDWESLRVQLNLPAVEEDEEPESAEIRQLPVVPREDAPDDDGGEGESDEVTGDGAIAAEDDFELARGSQDAEIEAEPADGGASEEPAADAGIRLKRAGLHAELPESAEEAAADAMEAGASLTGG